MSNMPRARKPVEEEDDEFGAPESIDIDPGEVIQRIHQNYLTQIGELQNSRSIAEAHSVRATRMIRELQSENEALKQALGQK